jgi:hypothetical protein
LLANDPFLDVAEVATDEVTEVMPDVATAVATELATGVELSHPLPTSRNSLKCGVSFFSVS